MVLLVVALVVLLPVGAPARPLRLAASLVALPTVVALAVVVVRHSLVLIDQLVQGLV